LVEGLVRPFAAAANYLYRIRACNLVSARTFFDATAEREALDDARYGTPPSPLTIATVVQAPSSSDTRRMA
jgi:hypothetical protein